MRQTDVVLLQTTPWQLAIERGPAEVQVQGGGCRLPARPSDTVLGPSELQNTYLPLDCVQAQHCTPFIISALKNYIDYGILPAQISYRVPSQFWRRQAIAITDNPALIKFSFLF